MKFSLSKSAVTKMQAAIIIVIILVVAIAGAVYYVTTFPPETTPGPIARLVRIGNAWPIYLDPAVGQDFASMAAQTNVYDPLVWPTPEGTIVPWVATNWTASSDGLVYNFSIRSGIKFHSGRELTAWDVAFSMNRLLTIGQGYAFLYKPYVDKAEALDTYTVKFTLKKLMGPFASSLIRLYIVDKQEIMDHLVAPGAYGDFGDYGMSWLTTHDAGSGPYKVKEIKLDAYVKVVIYPDYWFAEGFNPKSPTEIHFLPTAASPATQKTMMNNKELEVTDQWQSEEFLDLLDAMTGITKKSHADASEYYYMFHCAKKPTDDIHVRKALAYCYDYNLIMTEQYSRFTPSKSCVPMDLPGAIDCQIYYYNLTKAEEELKESKYYPDIIENPDNYEIIFLVMTDVPEREGDALHFAEQAAKIGLKVTIVKVPWMAYIEQMSNIDTAPHIATMAIGDYYLDTGAMLLGKYHSASVGTVSQNEWLRNDTIDAMIDDAIATSDETERLAKYEDIQRAIMDLCPTMFIYDYKVVECVQDYVSIPCFEDPAENIGVQGYNVVCRTWEVNPP